MPPKKGNDKEHADKKPAKTDKQKKAEAEMMKNLTTQYNGVLSPDDLKGMIIVIFLIRHSNQTGCYRN
ncbi:unnamed protein product [Rotaria sp. Silwood1]|nr:unnamed protein product [Rotaria sp. Silwood1]